MEVKEKKVELIELFYDLIYVYAISRLTLLIEEPVNGIIPLFGFLRYIVAASVFLLIGGTIMLNFTGIMFLVGALIATGGNFVMLLKKYSMRSGSI